MSRAASTHGSPRPRAALRADERVCFARALVDARQDVIGDSVRRPERELGLRRRAATRCFCGLNWTGYTRMAS
jgi:hypothetical protein